jgi:hypothetical protein
MGGNKYTHIPTLIPIEYESHRRAKTRAVLIPTELRSHMSMRIKFCSRFEEKEKSNTNIHAMPCFKKRLGLTVNKLQINGLQDTKTYMAQ